MTRPRIFISSTYYDLKYIRSSLENFINSRGFEAILSEKGHIAFSPDIPLDESCYREVKDSDIFVIIVGGRYGSEKSGSKKRDREFFERYDSITKQEYINAVERDIPVYILIEKSVYNEYETFQKNKTNESIIYAHVGSVNIFHLIEEILSQPRNNPVHHFDRYSDIEDWLKEQWAGLFRDLINQRSKQVEISSLASQIGQLEEITKTLKRYLEEVISQVSPKESKKLIADESNRLDEAFQIVLLMKNPLINYIEQYFGIQIGKIRLALIESESTDDFFQKTNKLIDNNKRREMYRKLILRDDGEANTDLNHARKILNLLPFESS
ncbi:MAG: DUF4062 domain-containing protein [Pirellulales bacterium]|nr:DUF4062 domain-containing protein [Pirellulales bacterium]